MAKKTLKPARKTEPVWRNRITRTGTAPASEFKANERNWRIHPREQRDALKGVLSEVGWVTGVITNKTTGNVIDGHARIEEALKLGDDTPVPFIEVELSEDEEAKILATFDPISAMAVADKEQLDALLRDVQSADAGVMQMLDDLAKANGLDYGAESGASDADAEPQIDKADELREKWGVVRGQVWQLGAHRLMCGDSTSAKDVARLDISKCEALIFDPEWDNAPQMKPMRNTIAFTDGQRCGDVVRMFGAPAWLFVWDCVTSWYTPNRPLKRGKLALWYGDVKGYDFNGAHYGESGEQKTVSNTRGEYLYKPDARGKHLSDVFNMPITQAHADHDHNHSKPVDWVRMLIANCTQGDVFDPFCGSGTTLIACQQIKRRCVAIEVEPKYVAVCLQRFNDAFGLEPQLIKAI
jgi:hypothetical protein